MQDWSAPLLSRCTGARPGGYKIFLILNSAEHEFYPAYKCKQWATIAHHGANIMLGDTIIYNALRQVTLNMKQ